MKFADAQTSSPPNKIHTVTPGVPYQINVVRPCNAERDFDQQMLGRELCNGITVQYSEDEFDIQAFLESFNEAEWNSMQQTPTASVDDGDQLTELIQEPNLSHNGAWKLLLHSGR